MLSRHGLVLATRLAVFAVAFGPTAQALHACSFVPDSFNCTREKSLTFARQCDCFSCSEIDGVGSYQCNGAVVCGANYTSTAIPKKKVSWSINAYISIGVIYLVGSVLLYAALRVLSRFTRVIKDDIDKDSLTDRPEPSTLARSYAYFYDWAFGTLYRSNGTDKRSIVEFWIAGCELLDCFWCGSNRKDSDHTTVLLAVERSKGPVRRPFYLRFARLLASLSVAASLGMAFGSLAFDAAKCRTHATVSFCLPGNTTQDVAINTTTCDSGPAVLDFGTLISPTSTVAFVSTQCIKFIGSHAYNIGNSGSKLDITTHVLWVLVSLLAVPTGYKVSSQLLSATAYASKPHELRMRFILSITLSTWIKDQALDLIKMPFVFVFKRMFSKCFPRPRRQETTLTVEPVRLGLAPPSYARTSGQDVWKYKYQPQNLDWGNRRNADKVDSITPPRRTSQQFEL